MILIYILIILLIIAVYFLFNSLLRHISDRDHYDNNNNQNSNNINIKKSKYVKFADEDNKPLEILIAPTQYN